MDNFRDIANSLPLVMVVDDDMSNLRLAKGALSEKFRVLTASSVNAMFAQFRRHLPDVILLDVNMPETDGYTAIKMLKADKNTSHIPVVFLTGSRDMKNELMGLELGAADFITKPFIAPLLIKRVEMQTNLHKLESEKAALIEQLKTDNLNLSRDITEFHDKFITTIADLIEDRDSFTGGHIHRTQKYVFVMLSELKNSDNPYASEAQNWNVALIVKSSQLHDVGKISVPDSILLKPDKLSDDEYEIMKQHTSFGRNIISKLANMFPSNEFLEYAKILAYTHHERWDGKSYPQGLSGEQTPLVGRVMAVADVYDALISHRPYKKPIAYDHAREIMVGGSGTQFDPLLIDLFLSIEPKFRMASEESQGEIRQ